jgi:hypothetical protein
MRFRACLDTPKSCACPLPEKHDPADEVACTCCVHMGPSTGYLWTRKGFCNDGKECVIACFPYRLKEQWEMLLRCMTVIGMGTPDISMEKFKFFVEDVLEIDKKHWLDIYDKLNLMLTMSQTHKEGNSHIDASDIAKIKALRKDGE